MPLPMDFIAPDYLKNGNARQQQAFREIASHRIMELLHPYQPILVGTIPIEIDIDSSDLDIICCWTDPKEFHKTITGYFGRYDHFQIRDTVIKGQASVVANFKINSFEVEIFGQAIPTTAQAAYRHMLVEHHLLRTHGEAFREKIVELKRQGYKTEPAFAHLLGLTGDPYEELLTYPIE